MEQYFFQFTTAVFAVLTFIGYMGLRAQKRTAANEKRELVKELSLRTLQRDENALFFFWVHGISSSFEVQQISKNCLKRFQMLHVVLKAQNRSLHDINICRADAGIWIRFQPVAVICADLLQLEEEIAAKTSKGRLMQMLDDLREKAMHEKVFFEIAEYQQKIDALSTELSKK